MITWVDPVTRGCWSALGDRPSLVASVAGPRRGRSRPAARAQRREYKIGYSNGGSVGNGFREEQVCTAKAQAEASGEVAELTTIHRDTDAAGQLSDIRDLIAKGVDAIVFNPNDPDALNPALTEAHATRASRPSRSTRTSPIRTPTTCTTTRSSTRSSAPSGCSTSSAARAPSGTCAVCRPPGRLRPRHRVQERRSRTTRASPSSTADGVFTGWDPADHHPADQ